MNRTVLREEYLFSIISHQRYTQKESAYKHLMRFTIILMLSVTAKTARGYLAVHAFLKLFRKFTTAIAATRRLRLKRLLSGDLKKLPQSNQTAVLAASGLKLQSKRGKYNDLLKAHSCSIWSCNIQIGERFLVGDGRLL